MDRRQFSATIAAIASCAVMPPAEAPLRGLELLRSVCSKRGLRLFVSDVEWLPGKQSAMFFFAVSGNRSWLCPTYVSRRQMLMAGDQEGLVRRTQSSEAESLANAIEEYFEEKQRQLLAIYG